MKRFDNQRYYWLSEGSICGRKQLPSDYSLYEDAKIEWHRWIGSNLLIDVRAVFSPILLELIK